MSTVAPKERGPHPNPPKPETVTLYGTRISEDIIKLRSQEISLDFPGTLHQGQVSSERRGETDREEGWSDVSTSQEMPGATSSWKRQKRISPEPSEGAQVLLTP